MICADYRFIAIELFVGLRSIQYIIPIVNFVFRTICIRLVHWIGYSTRTVELI